MIRLALLLLAGAAVADRSTRGDPDPARVDFARQIRPILAQK